MLRVFKWLLFMLPMYLNANEFQEQKFNDYSGDFKVHAVNFSYFAVSFSGQLESDGEVVFEVRPDEGYKHDIYKVVFFPKDASVFPAITEGFYPKKLDRIGLLNHAKAKALLFTDEQWQIAVSQNQRYISVDASIVLEQYSTSVECDSRQYYASISALTQNKTAFAYYSVREDVVGC